MNPTWYLWVFYRLLRPWMDPVTAAKIHLVDPEDEKKKKAQGESKASSEGMGGSVSSIQTYIHPDELLVEFGGNLEYEWNFDSYWGNFIATLGY